MHKLFFLMLCIPALILCGDDSPEQNQAGGASVPSLQALCCDALIDEATDFIDLGVRAGEITTAFNLIRDDYLPPDCTLERLREEHCGVYSHCLSLLRDRFYQRALSGALRVFDVLGRELAQISCIACSSDGTFIAIGTASGAVELYDRRSRKKIRSLGRHTKKIISLQFFIDAGAPRLISRDAHGGAKLWHCEKNIAPVSYQSTKMVRQNSVGGETAYVLLLEGNCIGVFPKVHEPYSISCSSHPRVLALSGDEHFLAVLFTQGSCGIWNMRQQKWERIIDDIRITSCVFSSDSAYLILGYCDGTIRLWHTGKHCSFPEQLVGYALMRMEETGNKAEQGNLSQELTVLPELQSYPPFHQSQIRQQRRVSADGVLFLE